MPKSVCDRSGLRRLGCLTDETSAEPEQPGRTMLSQNVTPVAHVGPSPHAPLLAARK
jgi:hypothetical protein